MKWLGLVLAGVAAGCAPGGGGSEPQSRPVAASRHPDRIVEAELLLTNARSALEAVQKLRPAWLRTRGPSSFRQSADPIIVYLDGQRIGSLDALRQLTIEGIKELRHFSALDATSRWGTNHGSGAIEVITRSP